MPIPPAARRALLTAALALPLLAGRPPSPGDRAQVTRRLVAAAIARAQVRVRYVADYVRIPYPGGDVPADTGVCADEIIRIYRAVGVDLQREVHEDVLRAPAAYPLTARPDPSIDHRRVKILLAFLRRHGEDLPRSSAAADYAPGDVVVWDLVAGHIGMVVDRRDPATGRPLVLHNVGRGPMIEDALFSWPILGHFRYLGP